MAKNKKKQWEDPNYEAEQLAQLERKKIKDESNFGLAPNKFVEPYLNERGKLRYKFIVDKQRLYQPGGFIGIPTLEERQWILNYHKLTVPKISVDWFIGFYEAEAYFKMSLGPKGMGSHQNIVQNIRQFHLLIAIDNLFGNIGSIGVRHPLKNSSRFGFTINSLKKVYNTVLPIMQQKKTPLGTDKRWQFERLAHAMDLWGTRQYDYQTIIDIYKNMMNDREYCCFPKEPLDVTRDWVAGFTDGDGGFTVWGPGDLCWSQKHQYPLLCLQKFFKGKGMLKAKGPKGGWEYTLRKPENQRVFLEFRKKHSLYRTDLRFKIDVVQSPVYHTPGGQQLLGKIPDRMPAIAVLFHARERCGFKFPDIITETLHTHYPLEMGVSYQQVYEEFYMNHKKIIGGLF